jgi:GPH family glycoside/pentoside/hexuronide:cation symporter
MFATYFNQAAMSGVVQMVGFLPMFLFMPFVKMIVNKFGKKEASVVGTIVSMAGGLIMLIFPLIQDRSIALIVYMCALVVFGLGMGIYTCVSWAMMGDAIDYNEWKFGTRDEGIVYSLHSFFRKLAQGVGPALAVAIMAANGYVNNSNPDANGVFQAIDVTLLGWDFAVWCRGLIAILYLVAGVMLFVGLGLVYNLDKKTLNQMTEELAARKAAK